MTMAAASREADTGVVARVREGDSDLHPRVFHLHNLLQAQIVTALHT